MRRIIQTALAVFLLILTASSVFADQSPQALADQLVQSTPGRVNISYHSGTGKVRFISVEPGNSIPNVAAIAATAAPADAAASFFSVYGPLFGISDPAKELRMKRQKKADRGRSFMRYQQIYKNVPVFGGELIVQMDAKNNVISAHGKVSPDLSIDVIPTIDSATAANTALNLVAKQYNIEPSSLTTSTPELWIYNPVLLDYELNKNVLVWRVEVKSRDLAAMKELVLIDAHSGMTVLHFNQLPYAKYRIIFDNQNNLTLGTPGVDTPTRSEGQAPVSESQVDNAYDYTGYAYDFYSSYHNRNSVDNQGMSIISQVRVCNDINCPPNLYHNCYWDGSQIVYSDGAATALDIVAHEYTHGVTQYESGLFYYMQSGAINESLSDIWGELIQQSYEPPATNRRWFIGENLPASFIPDGYWRRMDDPTLDSGGPDPDKMTSTYYHCGTSDNGGVHGNSGVNNKATYLVVDGGSFNGKTVTGIGITKTIKIYYEAQTNLLISSSDYADLYDILQLACNNLIGTSGITISDCQQVKNAVDAVEMNLQNPNCQSLCPPGTRPIDIFYEPVTIPDTYWDTVILTGNNAWVPLPYGAESFNYYIWGMDLPYQSLSYLQTAASYPISSNTYLHFVHDFSFEYGSFYYDGGSVAYSTNAGATWNDAAPYFINNGYNGIIYSLSDNPLAGDPAFVGVSNSYITSRLNLSSLAGQNVKFSFWLGTDSFNGYSPVGWVIDDVRLYNCIADTMVPVTINTSPIGQQITVDGNAFTSPKTFSWPQGTSHTVSVASPQAGATGTQYVYSSWSDGGAQSHSIVTPASATTCTANFTPEYLLTTNIVPPASGSVTPDCVGGCWYGSGSSISLSPTPSGSNTFKSWSGDVSSLDAPIQITINGPKNITAAFDSTTVTGTVRIVGTPPVYYTTIPLAYAAAVNNDVIQMQATSYAGAHTFDRTDIPGLTVTLKGGYNTTYSDNTGITTVASPLTIKTGTITLDNFVIE